MRLREQLLPLLTWKIGNGETCTIYAQPWFEGLSLLRPAQRNLSTRSLVIKDLTDQEGGWDVNKLVEFFGYNRCLQIIANMLPPRQQAGQDKLVFKLSTNGDFSVKKAYIHLDQAQTTGALTVTRGKQFWDLIWKKGEVQPRIRLFLWKAVRKAIPLGGILAYRISRGNPLCYLCGEGDEDVNHLFFGCQFARLCWFGGPLAMKSCQLGMNFADNIQLLGSQVQNSDWKIILNSIWAIWHSRNDCVYEGKAPTFSKFCKYLKDANREGVYASSMVKNILQIGQQGSQEREDTIEHECHVDGSWVSQWQSGLGYMLSKGGNLVLYRSSGTMACSPIQAEAQALKEAVNHISQAGITSCTFLTDNQVLAKAVTQFAPPIESDWRAFQEIMEVWRFFKQYRKRSKWNCR